ncbi:MAG: Xaa-Pro peptidase family protein [Proteobacteria bacterium]|nr:Xaa-Pro peptidase family protein [Pseudomonadota bacterium]
MKGFLDRNRASRMMADAGLDALVLMQPETLRWATGSFPGVATFWRRAGAAALVVPADPAQPLAAVVGDLQAEEFRLQSGIEDIRTHPIWVDTAWYDGATITPANQVKRPATYDPMLGNQALVAALGNRAGGKLGLELGFVPHADFAALAEALPRARLVDCSRVVERMRAFKQVEEVALLEQAGRAAEAGTRAMLAELRAGHTTKQLVGIWREAAFEAAAREGALGPVEGWAYIAIGEDGFAPGGPARSGDVIKIDVGCVINGYSSDSARTAVLGSANAMTRKVHEALLDAFEAAAALLAPGTPLRAIHAALHERMHRHGFPGFSRGHVGHSCGASIFSEEWPFISREAEETVEPGMVLALEAPWYVRGLGGFIIEDQFTISDAGATPLWTLPRSLIVVDG